MSWDRNNRPVQLGGIRVKKATVTSTGTVLPRQGLVVVGTTQNLKGKVFRLPKPLPGVEVTVLNAQPGSSKGAFKVQAGLTTAANFYGSTNGVITMTSGKKTGSVRLMGASTASWAIVAISTGITVAG
jgi:hypothetical protein